MKKAIWACGVVLAALCMAATSCTRTYNCTCTTDVTDQFNNTTTTTNMLVYRENSKKLASAKCEQNSVKYYDNSHNLVTTTCRSERAKK